MARYQGWFALVLALAIAAGMFLVRTPLELGLDLRGGSQLTVEVKPAEKSPGLVPKRWSTVAWKSCQLVGFSTAFQPTSSVDP